MEQGFDTVEVNGREVPFGGIDLSRDFSSLDLGVTDDEKNVIGDGTYVGKRPGMHLVRQVGGTTNPIYDMVRAAYGSGSNLAYDSIFMLCPNLEQDRVFYYRIVPSTVSSPTTITTSGGVGPYMDRRMLVANGRIFITSPRQVATYGNIFHAVLTNEYVAGLLGTGQCPTDIYTFGTRFKGHLFLHRAFDLNEEVCTLRYSDVNLPLSWLTPNTNTIDMASLLGGVIGSHSDGEHLYVSKPNEVWMITGATTETFRAERVSNVAGFYGIRSACIAGDTLLAISVEAGACREVGNPSLTDSWETYAPRNIMAIGGGAQLVGDKVAPIMENVKFSSRYEPRAEYHRGEKYALFVPDTSGDYTECPAIILDTAGKAYHKWGFYSDTHNHPISLLYAPGPAVTDKNRMYIGTRAGALQYLDEDRAYDDTEGSGTTPTGTENIESYWTLGWRNQWNTSKYKSPENVFIQGAQTTGGEATLEVAYDYGAWEPVRTFPLTRAGEFIALKGRQAKSYNFKVSFPFNGVKSRVTRFRVDAKPWGAS